MVLEPELGPKLVLEPVPVLVLMFVPPPLRLRRPTPSSFLLLLAATGPAWW